ncbi:MAG: class I SAM-dependent methyltransferase [Thermoplasmata archaeon]
MTTPRKSPQNPPRPHGVALSAARRIQSSNPPGRHRFLEWDDYRVDREWQRYEGSPLRDLYRELRERFLARHRPFHPGRSLEIGPGPGRFTRRIGHSDDRVTLLELSRAMLERVRADSPRNARFEFDLVQGDAVAPPFRPMRFHRVAMLGNVLGFAERDAPELLKRACALVAPGGRLLIEFVAGGGERSKYLHRLPTGAIARLFAAPVRALQPRVLREGFEPVRERDTGARRFRRFATADVQARLRAAGFEIKETVAVAPCLGNDASRLTAIRAAPRAWGHLLELEEAIGREPNRQSDAAALLVAAERPPP